MKIIDIKESGSNNTLTWAINNDADIKSDRPLQSIINDELFYLVTIEDVNMFELFRLTQTYRNKLKICEEKLAAVPNSDILHEKFPGAFNDPEDSSKSMPLHEVAEHCISNFINIALQMHSDDDIINTGAARLFIPMIARNFTVKIPISFVDVIDACHDSKAADKIFNKQYPDTLNGLVDSGYNDVVAMISFVFVKLTSVIKLNQRLETYLQFTKYAPLKKSADNRLYKIYLTSFHKFNPVSRSEVRCSLFNIDGDRVSKELNALNKVSSPLELDFAVQLPIQLMQILENMFGPDMLTISYESSMISILDGGLIFNDFVAPEAVDEESSPDRINAIGAYRARLTEANQFMLNTIKVLSEDPDSDNTSTFALLPSIYLTKAVITVKMDLLKPMIDVLTDSSLKEMFINMLDTANKIQDDITKAANT